MKLFKKKEKELEKEIDLKAMEEDGASKRTLTGGWEKFIFFFALAMALFHIYALVLSSTTAWYLYCVHADAGAVMTFALYRGTKKSPINRPSAPDVVLMVLIAAAFTYMCVEMNTLVYRIGVNPKYNGPGGGGGRDRMRAGDHPPYLRKYPADHCTASSWVRTLCS